MIVSNFFNTYDVIVYHSFSNKIIRALLCLSYKKLVINGKYNEHIIHVNDVQLYTHTNILKKSIVDNDNKMFTHIIDLCAYINYHILRLVSFYGNFMQFKYICDNGATICQLRSDCNYILQCMTTDNYVKKLKYIDYALRLEDLRFMDNIILRASSERGDIAVLEYLFEKGINLDDIRIMDNYAFKCASRRGRLSILKLLYSKGLNIDDVRSENNYAIKNAIVNGHTSVVKFLLSIGLNIDDVRSENNYAIKNAVACGHISVVKYLLSIGLNMIDVRFDNNYAIKHAALNGHNEIIEYLFDNGFHITDIQPIYDYSIIEHVAVNGHIEVFKLLYGDCNLYNKDFELFLLAADKYQHNIMRYLSSMGLTLPDTRMDTYILRHIIIDRYCELSLEVLCDMGLSVEDIATDDYFIIRALIKKKCSNEIYYLYKRGIIILDDMYIIDEDHKNAIKRGYCAYSNYLDDL